VWVACMMIWFLVELMSFMSWLFLVAWECVYVCFLLSARYLPLPSWSCCALNQGMPSSSSNTNNTALGEGESRA